MNVFVILAFTLNLGSAHAITPIRACVNRLTARVSSLKTQFEELAWRRLNPGQPLPRELRRAKEVAQIAHDGKVATFDALAESAEKVDWVIQEAKRVGAELHWSHMKPAIPQLLVNAHILARSRLSTYCFYLHKHRLNDQFETIEPSAFTLNQEQRDQIDDLLGGYCQLIHYDFWSKYEM